jgi:hypothetical protein
MSTLFKLGDKFAAKLQKQADAAADSTPVDQLTYPQLAAYMKTAGMTFSGAVEGDQIGFTFGGVKYAMQIVSASFIRFAPLDNKNGQMWQVPPPQQTIKKNQYLGIHMPSILKMIANTVR